MTQPTNIDELFAEAMRPIGGQRPEEIDPDSTRLENADVVFQAENVIAEVKTIMQDPAGRENIDNKLREMYSEWAAAGKVPDPIFGTIKIDTKKLPEDCAIEWLNVLTRGVGRVIGKANQQIKQTKASLSMPDAKGLFVICNSGAATLKPDVLLWRLARELEDGHPDIDWLLYLTYDLPIQFPDVPVPANVFGQPVRTGREPMPRDFYYRLNDAWMSNTNLR